MVITPPSMIPVTIGLPSAEAVIIPPTFIKVAFTTGVAMFATKHVHSLALLLPSSDRWSLKTLKSGLLQKSADCCRRGK